MYVLNRKLFEDCFLPLECGNEQVHSTQKFKILVFSNSFVSIRYEFYSDCPK